MAFPLTHFTSNKDVQSKKMVDKNDVWADGDINTTVTRRYSVHETSELSSSVQKCWKKDTRLVKLHFLYFSHLLKTSVYKVGQGQCNR